MYKTVSDKLLFFTPISFEKKITVSEENSTWKYLRKQCS